MWLSPKRQSTAATASDCILLEKPLCSPACTSARLQLLAEELKAFWPTAVAYLGISVPFSYENFYVLVASFVFPAALHPDSARMGCDVVLGAGRNGTRLGGGMGTVAGTGCRCQASGTKVQPTSW